MFGSKHCFRSLTWPARLMMLLSLDMCACLAAGALGAGASRAGAGLPPRSAAAPPKPDKKLELLGVSKVDTGRWAATICVKDTGDELDLGTCAPSHRLL